MNAETAVWCAFAGSAFALMGANLAAGAEEHAASALQWNGREGGGRGLAAAYRAAGAAFLLLGLALMGAAGLRPEMLARFFKPMKLGAVERRAAGLLFAGCGAVMAFQRLSGRGLSRLPAALEAELPPEPRPPLRRRAAAWADWLLVADMLLFGCFLLWRR